EGFMGEPEIDGDQDRAGNGAEGENGRMNDQVPGYRGCELDQRQGERDVSDPVQDANSAGDPRRFSLPPEAHGEEPASGNNYRGENEQQRIAQDDVRPRPEHL